jgi:hypothetical protein
LAVGQIVKLQEKTMPSSLSDLALWSHKPSADQAASSRKPAAMRRFYAKVAAKDLAKQPNSRFSCH